MADEADRKSPEASDKLLLDLAWERQQKKVSALLNCISKLIPLQSDLPQDRK